MRLWELEEGDGDDVGIGFAGGVREVEIPPEAAEEVPVEAVAADEPDAAAVPDMVVEEPDIPRPELQREGPLVLRINQQPQPAPVAPAVPDPPPANRRQGGNQRQQDAPRHPGPALGGRRMLRQRQGREDLARQREAANQEAAQQAWVQMFVQMAMNDEEDLLDSDDDDDGAAWEIPVR